MDTSIFRYCLSILLLITTATSVESNETNNEESREPRVSGRIVKLYSGAKPEPYLCTGDGFQLDPSNCAAFYRCVKERSGKFTVFRYQCAPGTVYDPDLETCNHPHSTRRTECGGMLKPNTDKPHEMTNMNEIDGVQSELPRPISTQLPIYSEMTTLKNPTAVAWVLSTESPNPTKNPWTSTTYKSPKTLSANTKKASHSTTANQWLYSTQQRWELEYTSKSPPITTQNSNSKNSEPCTSDGFMGDSENCRKFYRCVGNLKGTYIKYEFFCSKSTVWDDEIQGCNHPWAVQRSKCASSMFSDHKSAPHKLVPDTVTVKDLAQTNEQFGYKQNKTIQQQLQISHGPEVTQTQTQISSSPDVIQNQTQINYGEKSQNNTNSKSKQNQTQISYGTAVSQTQTQIDYGSKGMQTQLQIDHSKDSSQSQVQIVDSITHSTTGSSNNGKTECSQSGFMGDTNDCKKFYRCVDNGRGYTKYEFSCGDGTVWDPEIEACNHAWAVKECGSKLPTTETHTLIHTTAKSTESHREQNKTTPSYATNPVPDIDEEDSVGYGNQNNLDTTTTSTTLKKSTTAKLTTQNPNKPSTECTNSGFMGDPNDCQVFYRCVNNGNGGFIKYDFECGDGTVWDPDIEACNHAWAVKSCGGTSSSSFINKETTTKKETKPTENTYTTVTLVQISTQAPSLDEDYDTGYGSQNIETSKITTSEPTKTPQKQDSTEISVCQSSGFIGDNNDCKKFYRCVDNGNGGYIKYEFTCGQGTVWDPKIDACNHDWAVEKCGGSNNVNETTSYETTSQSSSITSSGNSSSTATTQVSKVTETPKTTVSYGSSTTLSTDNKCSNSGFMGDNNSCKKFYRCVDNGDGSFTRYEFTCGEGTVWDETIEACNHAWAVKQCGGSGSSITNFQNESTTQATSSSNISEGEQSQHSTEKLTTTTEPHQESETSVSDKCTQEGFYGDKKDCRKFYRCVNNEKGRFNKYEFICGEGTVWNQEIQSCDHPSSDKSCSSGSSTLTHTTGPQTESTTSSFSSTSSTTTKTQATTDKTETTGNMGIQCTSEGFFAHITDCKKFIRCVDNGNGGYTRYEFSCGDGTIWVQEIQACDHDNDVNSCDAHVSSTTQASNTPSNSSSSSVISSTENIPLNDEYDTQTSNELSHDETDDCTSEGYFGNKQDCRKFYRCVDNGKGGYIKYDFVCGEGTAWDSDLQTCNHINEVQSCSGSTSNGNGHPQTTTKKNEPESESTTSSTTKATSSTGSSTNSQDTCESEGYFGDSKNCKKFYRCVDNGKGGYIKYDFTCGEGTIWDQDITTCNHPQDVSNPSCNSTQGTSDLSSTTSSTTSSQTTSSTTQGSTQSTSDSSSKSPANNNVTCDKAGYYANPNDCKKFYRCVDWDGEGKKFSVFHFECGEGTIWDPALDTCNYEDSVYPPRDCSQTQSQNVGGETTSTEKSTTSTTESTTREPTTEVLTTTLQTSEKTTTEQSNESTIAQTTQESTTSETTTQQTTTSEKTTTQESTTTEQSTTQQPTSSEKTTTQKSTTSEPTTQQATTSEQTTTQQTTTSEKTTTEQTTTQQMTTSEQSTTEQITTSEQTTTQQPTTSEPAQQSTSEEATTVSGTTEQSTTEQTNESTTQETTTTEQTTTQLSTTSEQTTTQKSTTSEHSTTTEQTTTQQATTEQITEPTTEQSSTTTEQSTDGTTTLESTTDGTTTDATTTEETTDQSTTQISSTESDSAEDSSSTTEQSSSNKECPETEDDQYLLVCPTSFKRHPKYCNMFYQCTEEDDTYESKVAMFKCPNNTIYDENQTKCVTEDKADKKCEGEIANKRRFKRLGANYKEMIVADEGKQSCSSAGYFSFEKRSECAKGFLKCEKSKNGKLRGYVYQCPDGYVYWSISKRCERTEKVRDCKRSSNDWTGRWNIPIERKNVAS